MNLNHNQTNVGTGALTIEAGVLEPEITDLFEVSETGIETLKAPVPVHAIPAYSGGRLYLRGWELPVVLNMATLTVRELIPILYVHDATRILGHTTGYNLTDTDVSFDGVLTNLESSDVHEVVRTSKRGTRWQSSVGLGGQQVDPTNRRLLRTGQKEHVNGRDVFGPCYILENIEIAEWSIVPTGADRDNNHNITVEAALRQKETTMDPNELKSAILAAMGEALDKVLAADPETVDAEGNCEDDKKTVEAEGETEDDKKTVEAEGETEDDKKTVEAEGETEDDKKTVEAAGLNTIIVNGKKYFSSPAEAKFKDKSETTRCDRKSGAPNGRRTVEAALLMSYGGMDGKTVEAAGYSQNEINQALNPDYRGYTIHQLYRDMLTNFGSRRYNGSPMQLVTDGMKLLKGGGMRTVNAAGLSTVYDSGIFGNVLNKHMAKEYEDIDDESDCITERVSAKDFKEVSFWKFNMEGAFEEVAPGGEFPMAKFSDAGFTNAVKKSGMRFDLTFEDQVNDDMGAFLRNGARVARIARIKKVKARWKALIDQISSLTNAAKTTGALGAAGLGNATKAFRSRKDSTNEFILARPQMLLVPPALEATADELYVSRELVGGSSKAPNANVWVGKYRPVVCPYLGGSSLGGTDTNWFLASDAKDLPVLQELYMEGFDKPQTKSWEVFETLSIAYLAFYVWKVKFYDETGLVYSPGT